MQKKEMMMDIAATCRPGAPGLMTRIRANLSSRRAFRRTMEELDRLSDHDLADIGLSRAGVRQVAEDAANLAWAASISAR